MFSESVALPLISLARLPTLFFLVYYFTYNNETHRDLFKYSFYLLLTLPQVSELVVSEVYPVSDVCDFASLNCTYILLVLQKTWYS